MKKIAIILLFYLLHIPCYGKVLQSRSQGFEPFTDTGQRVVSSTYDRLLLSLGTGTSGGQMLYWDNTNLAWLVSDETKLKWDDTNDVLLADTLHLTNPLTVSYGGTGLATITDGGVLLGSGTGAVTAMSVLADGEFIVGDGTTDPVAESGATARTSLGLGTGDNVQFAAITGTSFNGMSVATTSSTITLGATGGVTNEWIFAVLTPTSWSLGNPVVSSTSLTMLGSASLNQSLQTTDSPTFVGLTLSGAIATPTSVTASGTVTGGAFSSAGDATINDLIIGNARYIGSASDTDAIAIAADGKTTFTQDLTVNEDIIIGDAKYIGPISDPDAIQLEADGDVVLTQDLAIAGTLGAGQATITKMNLGGGLTTFTLNGVSLNSIVGATSAIDTELQYTALQHSNTPAAGARFMLSRSRGTFASQLKAEDNDVLAAINASGYDDTDYVLAGEIAFEADGATGGNDMPGRIVFKTTADGAVLPAAKWTIKNTGDLLSGTDGTGDYDILTAGTLGCGTITSTGNVVVADAANIGSVSDPDAIQIEADGDIVMTQDLAVTGVVTGGSFITGGNIGVSGDTDLVQLSANTVVVNGSQQVDDVTAFTTSITPSGQDNLFITNNIAGQAVDNIAGSIAFGSTVNDNRRTAAIVAVETGADSDEMGLAFYTHPSASGSAAIVEKMRLDDEGNLGLSTTSPDDTLQVVGSAGFGDDAGNEVIVESDGDMVFKEGAGLAFGDIHGRDESSTVTISGAGIANKVQITAFDTDTAEHNIDADHTNDHIQITVEGFYLCAVSISIESVAAGGADKIGMAVYKNNGATIFPNCHNHRKLAGGGGDVGSVPLSGIIDCAVNDTIEVWIWNEDSADDVVVDDITLSLVQIGGT